MYHVTAAYILLCPFQELCNRDPFSISNHGLRVFLCNSVLAMLENQAMVSDDAPEAVDTAKIIDEFVTQSKTLSKEFQAKGRKILSSRKKIAKDYYFTMLGYGSISALKN